jgi:hypothetical protein
MNDPVKDLIDGERGIASLDSWIFYDDRYKEEDFSELAPPTEKKKRGRKPKNFNY